MADGDIKSNLINKLKGHDWFYEYSDDQEEWRKGLLERQDIYQLFCNIPTREIEGLILEYVPKTVQSQFALMLTTYSKNVDFINNSELLSLLKKARKLLAPLAGSELENDVKFINDIDDAIARAERR